MEVRLAVGALAPHITEQLNKFGLMVDGADHYQHHLNAVTRLLLNNYLTPSQAEKIRGKIIKQVFANMVPKDGAA